jgi:hypothetical protein
MKKFLACAGVWVAVALALVLDAAAVTNEKALDISNFRMAYRKALVEIDAEAENATKLVDNAYLNDLIQLADKFQKAGDLDGWEAVNAEQKRLVQKGEGPVVDANTPFKPAWDKYAAAQEKTGLNRARQTLTLANRYVATLETLKKKLTQDGSFSLAREAKDEQDAIAQFPEVVAANAFVAGHTKPGLISRVFSPAPSAPKPLPFEKNLVLYFNCAKNDPKTLVDLSAGKHDGSIRNAKWTSKGASGGAYEFDGDGDYIDFDPDHDISRAIGRGDLTIALWAEVKTPPRSPESYLLTEQMPSPPWTGIILMTEAGGRIRFRLSDIGSSSSSVFADGRDILDDGKMHCFVGLREEGVLKLYIDGKLADKKTVPDVSLRTNFLGEMRIGAHVTESRSANFKGTFYQLMVYDRALSDSEVRQLTSFRK